MVHFLLYHTSCSYAFKGKSGLMTFRHSHHVASKCLLHAIRPWSENNLFRSSFLWSDGERGFVAGPVITQSGAVIFTVSTSPICEGYPKLNLWVLRMEL